MRWIAPSAKATATLEKRLWAATEDLWADSGLNPVQYPAPVLGCILPRFPDARFAVRRAELVTGAAGGGSRIDSHGTRHASGVLFQPVAPGSHHRDHLVVCTRGDARCCDCTCP